jgi:periplasmic protein TonB
MSEATFDRAVLLPDTLGDWYRARPFQIAFALSLIVHAALIALVPGFRPSIVEPPQVLSVQIVQPDEPRVVQQPRQAAVPPPPAFAPSAPQPRPLEQPPVEVRPQIEPVPAPVLRQPELKPQEPVARADLAPPVPAQKPAPQPLVQPQPRPVPEAPLPPLIERQPLPELERPALSLPPTARTDPKPQAVTPIRPAPAPAPPVVIPRVESPAPPVVQPQAPPMVQPQVQPAPVARAEPRPPVPVPPPVAAPPQVSAPPPPVASVEPPRAGPVTEDAASMRALTASFSQQVSSRIQRYQRYPMVAQRRGWEGTAEVLVRFDADGKVSNIVLGKSTGRDILDEEAVNMVRRATPLPEAPQGLFGREIRVPIVFRLQDS